MMRIDAEAIATLSYEYIGNQVIANGWAISGVQFVQTYTIEEGNVVLEEMVYPELPQANYVKDRSDLDGKIFIGGFINAMITLATEFNPCRATFNTADTKGSR